MYLVNFTSAEGKAAQHWSDSLEEAVKFIERVRNSESVNDAKLYQLTEIPLEVKAYYKVELGGPSSSVDSPLSTLEADPREPAATS